MKNDLNLSYTFSSNFVVFFLFHWNWEWKFNRHATSKSVICPYIWSIRFHLLITFLCHILFYYQEEVYANTTKVLMSSVTNGFNATVFAYGATGTLLMPSCYLLLPREGREEGWVFAAGDLIVGGPCNWNLCLILYACKPLCLPNSVWIMEGFCVWPYLLSTHWTLQTLHICPLPRQMYT